MKSFVAVLGLQSALVSSKKTQRNSPAKCKHEYRPGSFFDYPHDTVLNDCPAGTHFKCDDGEMIDMGAPVDCPCFFGGTREVPNGYYEDDCVSGKAYECVNGSIEYRGAAKGCERNCFYPQNPSGDEIVPHGFIDNDCDSGKALKCVDSSMIEVPAEGCQKDCPYYKGPAFGVVMYQNLQTYNDCRSGKLMECIDGTMVATGPASGCGPAGCTFEGRDVEDGFYIKDCASGFSKLCDDGTMQILETLSVPEDCPYLDCYFHGQNFDHGSTYNDCKNTGKKFDCDNGDMKEIGKATMCGATNPCFYSKTNQWGFPWEGEVPHGHVDHDCVSKKAVKCVNGSMEYLGPAEDCPKDCQYSKNNKVVTVPHNYDDNDCEFTGKLHVCVDGVMQIVADAYCEEQNGDDFEGDDFEGDDFEGDDFEGDDFEGDDFVPPADPPLTQVTNMVDDFTSIAKTNLGVGSTLYNSVVIPVNKITKRMKSVNRRFNCENGTQVKKSRRVQRSANPCETIISLIDDIIAWNKENVFSCYKDDEKPAQLGKSYDKKLNMAKTKLVKRCEKRRFKD